MDSFIFLVAVILILAYIGLAIWMICERETIAGSAVTAAAFLGGGLIIVPAAEAAATVLCWVIVIGIVLAIIGAVFGG